MGFWSAMVWIIAISAITLVMLAKYGAGALGRGKGHALADQQQSQAQIAALRAELDQFKDRIAVLERIATENDRGLMLDREIAQLRSLPVE